MWMSTWATARLGDWKEVAAAAASKYMWWIWLYGADTNFGSDLGKRRYCKIKNGFFIKPQNQTPTVRNIHWCAAPLVLHHFSSGERTESVQRFCGNFLSPEAVTCFSFTTFAPIMFRTLLAKVYGLRTSLLLSYHRTLPALLVLAHKALSIFVVHCSIQNVMYFWMWCTLKKSLKAVNESLQCVYYSPTVHFYFSHISCKLFNMFCAFELSIVLSCRRPIYDLFIKCSTIHNSILNICSKTACYLIVELLEIILKFLMEYELH